MPEVHQAQSSAVLQHCPAVLHRQEIPSSAPQDHWWTAAIPPKLSRHDPPVRFRKLLDRSPTGRTHARPAYKIIIAAMNVEGQTNATWTNVRYWAHSGHWLLHCTCPLLGAKQTSTLHRKCLLLTQSGHER